MVFGLDYDAVDKLTSMLASSHGFPDAVEELRQLCTDCSSACISDTDLATVSQSPADSQSFELTFGSLGTLPFL